MWNNQVFFTDVDAKWLHQCHINGSKFPTRSKKRSAATSLHSAKTEWKTMPFGTEDAFFVCMCASVSFHGDDGQDRAELHVLTFNAACCVFFSFIFTPPLRCLTFACLRPHTCSAHTDSHNISVAMVTLSEATRFPGTGVALSDPPLCLLRSRGQTSAWLLNKRRVYLSRLHISVFFCDLCSLRVRAYNSIEQTQECRTGCGKKIPERVYMKNKPWGACNWNIRALGTLNYVPWVQFTPSHTTFLCDLSNFLSL